MAEQYSYFGRFPGPNIDVNLYPNAATAGIAAGNARPSVTSSIAKGVVEGINNGINVNQGLQQIDLNNQQGQLNSAKIAALGTPEQQAHDAELDRRLKEAQVAQAEAQTQATAITGTKTAEIQAAEATTKLGDLKILDTLGNLLSSPTSSPTLEAALLDPRNQAALARHPVEAGSILADSQGRVSPETYSQAFKAVEAVNIQKQVAQVAQKQADLEVTQRLKKSEDYADANLTLKTQVGDLTDLSKNPSYNARELSLVRSDIISGNTDPSTKKRLLEPPLDPNQKPLSYTWMYKGQPVEGASPVDPVDHKAVATALRTHQEFFAAHNAPQPVTPSQEAAASAQTPEEAQKAGVGLAGHIPVDPNSSSAPSSVDINQNILDRAKARQAAAAKAVGPGYAQMVIDGRASVMQLRPSATPQSYLTTTQATPTPTNTPAITVAVPTPMTLPDPKKHIESALGVTEKNISFDLPISSLDKNAFETVNNIPELKNAPAVLKGLIYIESKGNPNAISSAGAQGLTQLVPGTAQEVGVTNPFNPEQSVQGGLTYLVNKYNEVNKQLQRVYTDAGLPPVTPDPRIVFAAYNGGFKDVKKAINAGNTDWEGIADYIRQINLKSPKALKENLEYPDKVLNASLSFIKGGNASDDLYMGNLISNGIISVDTTGYGNRLDGSPKGEGFLGELKRPDGKISTELSIGVNIDGKEVQIPSLIPGLTDKEKNSLLNLKEGEKPSQAIIDKATQHAKKRIKEGLSPFKQEGETTI